MSLGSSLNFYFYFLRSGYKKAKVHNLINVHNYGDAQKGHNVLYDRCEVGGEYVSFKDFVSLDGDEGEKYYEFLFSFVWLEDLATVNTQDSLDLAISIIKSWFCDNNCYKLFKDIAYKEEIAANRAWILIKNLNFLGDFAFDPRMARAIYFHILYLNSRLKHKIDLEHKVKILKINIFYEVVFATQEKVATIKKHLSHLSKVLKKAILPDGSFFNKNNQKTFQVLQDLIDIKFVLNLKTIHIPKFLNNAIDRIIVFIRTIRHLDGTLATFNGSLYVSPTLIDHVIARVYIDSDMQGQHKYSGYQRFSERDFLLILDRYNTNPSREIIPFEFSAFGEKVLTNLGKEDKNQNLVNNTAFYLRDNNYKYFCHEGIVANEVKTQVAETDVTKRLTIGFESKKNHFSYHKTISFYKTDRRIFLGEDLITFNRKSHFSKMIAVLNLAPGSKVIERGEQSIVFETIKGQIWVFESTGTIKINIAKNYSDPSYIEESIAIRVSKDIENSSSSISWVFEHIR